MDGEVFVLFASMVVAIALAYAFGRAGAGTGRDLVARLRALDPWMFVVFAGLCAWVVAGPFDLVGNILFAALLGLLAWFARAWRLEFGILMNLKDGAFPGRHDKVIWAALLVLLPPVGLWTFHTYRRAHWPETEGKPVVGAADLF